MKIFVAVLADLLLGCARGLSLEDALANCLATNPQKEFCYTVYNAQKVQQMHDQEMMQQSLQQFSDSMPRHKTLNCFHTMYGTSCRETDQ